MDEAYRKLEEMIVTAELKPGSIVSETEVANHLGLGRTPVREAFKKLVNTHLVQFCPEKVFLYAWLVWMSFFCKWSLARH